TGAGPHVEMKIVFVKDDALELQHETETGVVFMSIDSDNAGKPKIGVRIILHRKPRQTRDELVAIANSEATRHIFCPRGRRRNAHRRNGDSYEEKTHIVAPYYPLD